MERPSDTPGRYRSFWWRFIPAGLSFVVPGLGFVVMGRPRRFVVWLVLMAVLEACTTAGVRTSMMFFSVCLALTMAAALGMMADSFRMPTGFSKRRVLVIALSIVLYHGISWIVDVRYSVDSISFARCGGGCMSPTMRGRGDKLRSDMVVVDGAAYVRQAPQRGDMVLISTNAWPGPANHSTLTKRIAGLPNERVSIVPPFLCINGSPVTSPPVFSAIAESRDGYAGYCLGGKTPGVSLMLGSTSDVYVTSSNCYFLLGDNSSTSLDSRYFGQVHRTNIVGRIIGIVWPPARIRDL